MRAGMSTRTSRDAPVDIEHRFLAVAHEDKLDSLVRVLRGDDAGAASCSCARSAAPTGS